MKQKTSKRIRMILTDPLLRLRLKTWSRKLRNQPFWGRPRSELPSRRKDYGKQSTGRMGGTLLWWIGYPFRCTQDRHTNGFNTRFNIKWSNMYSNLYGWWIQGKHSNYYQPTDKNDNSSRPFENVLKDILWILNRWPAFLVDKYQYGLSLERVVDHLRMPVHRSTPLPFWPG